MTKPRRIKIEDDEGNFIYLDIGLTDEELAMMKSLVEKRSTGTLDVER